jgi:hypothetical protein
MVGVIRPTSDEKTVKKGKLTMSILVASWASHHKKEQHTKRNKQSTTTTPPPPFTAIRIPSFLISFFYQFKEK